MEREEIVKHVNDILAEEFEIELTDITPEANLKDTLSLDSLSLTDLIALVQVNYKVTIPPTDLKKIETFDNLYDYILEHLPK